MACHLAAFALLVALLVLDLAQCSAAGSTLTVSPSSNLTAELNALASDTVVTFQAGTYSLGETLVLNLAGADGLRIVLQGSGNASTQLVVAPNGTALDLGASFVTVQDMAINGSVAVTRASTSLEFFRVVINGGSLLVNATSSNITVRRCEIVSEAGVEFGCAAGSCVVTSSLVQGTYFHPAAGSSRLTGVLVRRESSGNVIEENSISGYASAIIVEGSASVASTPNIIRGNYLRGASSAAISFGTAVSITNNLINIASYGLLAKGNVSAALIAHNTIISTATCLNVDDRGVIGSLDATVSVVNNAFFCSPTTYNLITPGTTTALFATNAVQLLDTTQPPNSDLLVGGNLSQHFFSTSNLYPIASSALVGCANSSRVTLPDFACLSTPPLNATCGAYQFRGDGSAVFSTLLPRKVCGLNLVSSPPAVSSPLVAPVPVPVAVPVPVLVPASVPNGPSGASPVPSDSSSVPPMAITSSSSPMDSAPSPLPTPLSLAPPSPTLGASPVSVPVSAPVPTSAALCASNGGCRALQLCGVSGTSALCSACPASFNDTGRFCNGTVNALDRHSNAMKIKPFVYCWDRSVSGRWMAIFAYTSSETASVPVPRGQGFNELFENALVIDPRIEQSLFRPGQQIAFVATSLATQGTLKWLLDGWDVRVKQSDAGVRCNSVRVASLNFTHATPIGAAASCLADQYARFTSSTTSLGSVSPSRFTLTPSVANVNEVRLDVSSTTSLTEPTSHELLAWLAAYNGHGLARAAEQCGLAVSGTPQGRLVSLPPQVSAAYGNAVLVNPPMPPPPPPSGFQLWWLGPIGGGVAAILLIVAIVLIVRKYQRDHRSAF